MINEYLVVVVADKATVTAIERLLVAEDAESGLN